MSPMRYGDMNAFRQKLLDMGYEKVDLFDTTKLFFRSPAEARLLGLKGSTLLLGKNNEIIWRDRKLPVPPSFSDTAGF